VTAIRLPVFHHDIASKLQGLVMTLDEIAEYADTYPDIRQATEIGQAIVRELNQMLNANRALTKPPQRAKVTLEQVVERAAGRQLTKLSGTIAPATIEVAVPLLAHAIVMLIEAVSGPGQGHAVDVASAVDGKQVTLTLSRPAGVTVKGHAADQIAVAAWLVEREGGTLRCSAGEARFQLTLPIAG
jgi:hypothetical protein